MPSFADWLDRLLTEGEVALAGPPPAEPSASAAGVLARAYAVHALDVAGPAPPFDGRVAAAAAGWLGRACWFLVGPDDPGDALAPFGEPTTPSDHLSADLTLRFLPVVLQRARRHEGDDPLGRCVVELLRRWPLSGVLADIAEAPLVPLDFGGHAGLQLLYAERWAAAPRPAWAPPEGPARDRAELVFAQLGATLPAAPRREDAA